MNKNFDINLIKKLEYFNKNLEEYNNNIQDEINDF